MGGCIPLGDGALPYAPVVEALRGFARRVGPDDVERVFGHGRSELARLVPDLGPVADGSGSPSGLSIGSAQGRLFELLLGVLERLAADGARRVHRRGPPLVRPVDARPARLPRSQPARRAGHARLHLPLGRAPPAPSAAALPGRAGADRPGRADRARALRPPRCRRAARGDRRTRPRRALVESIHARSGGNAFFAEELLAAAGDDGRTELPSTLRDVLLARVATLAERDPGVPARRVRGGSIASIPRSSPRPSRWTSGRCTRRCARASAGRSWYPTRRPASSATRSATPSSRRRCTTTSCPVSGRVSTRPSRGRSRRPPRDGNTPCRRARLPLVRGARPAARARGRRPGGRRGRGRLRLPGGGRPVRARRRAVGPGPRRRGRGPVSTAIDLLATLAGVSRFHEPARAVSHIEAAIRLVDEDADPIRAGLLYERLGRYAWIAGQGDRSQDAYRAAMALIPQEPPTEARARALAGLSQILMLAGWFEESSRPRQRIARPRRCRRRRPRSRDTPSIRGASTRPSSATSTVASRT